MNFNFIILKLSFNDSQQLDRAIYNILIIVIIVCCKVRGELYEAIKKNK